MPRNSYVNSLTAVQMLAYVLRSISEGKNEDQIAERFDGNSFNEPVITPDGKSYLEKFDSDR